MKLVDGRKAVFLDKDGTLLVDVPFNVDPARIRFAPGAVEACRRLHANGYRLIVVSNQSGVARGLFPREALEGVESFLRRTLVEGGASLDGFLFCPHHPDGVVEELAHECDCRKPAPGMLRRAANDLGLDLSSCWMVGDILDDVAAGRSAGCRTILLDSGGETEWRWSPIRRPDVFAGDFEQVADAILAADSQRETG